ncbi:DUF1737 domain-containing protein [Burkholderia cenocepacia]|uniref:DUF1737 domain-containing protein n=1 Tax=Burkholderia cenocepacia TaxID=95486 RepID=UPI00076BD745|nr:DUF1737 domain-containing protein [Burkholderia cenocepacia]KWU26283.1 hypothetical protein AS149_25160 [Burkholderia cenocepacia]
MKKRILLLSFAASIAGTLAASVALSQPQVPAHQANEDCNNYVILSVASRSLAPSDLEVAERKLAAQVSTSMSDGYQPLGGVSLAAGGGQAFIAQAMAAPNRSLGNCR